MPQPSGPSARTWQPVLGNAYLATNTATAASAAALVGAAEISRTSAFMAGCSDFGTLLSGLAVLPTQHRCWRVPGKTSSSALQEPRAPTATAGAATSPLHVDQQFAPALRAFAHADGKADQFLPALRRGADRHRHALGLILQPGLEVGLDVAARRHVARLPALVLGLPLPSAAQPSPVTGCGRSRPQRCQRLLQGVLEVARRDAAQVRHRQQGIQAALPPRPARQHRRGEPDAFHALASPAVPDLGAAHRDGADPGLRSALGAAAVPDKTDPTIRQPQLRPGSRKGLQVHGLRQQSAGASPQHLGQGIIDSVGLAEPHDVAKQVSQKCPAVLRSKPAAYRRTKQVKRWPANASPA